MTFDVAKFDPTISSAGGTITVPNMVYNRRLGFVGGPNYDPLKLELEPELASAWERTPDGSVFTRPMTSADIKFAFDRYSAEGVHKSYWTNISHTETPDDTTFIATMGSVTADFLLPIASRYQTIFPRETVDDGR